MYVYTYMCIYIYIYIYIERERERICSKGWVALQRYTYTICDKNLQRLGPQQQQILV